MDAVETLLNKNDLYSEENVPDALGLDDESVDRANRITKSVFATPDLASLDPYSKSKFFQVTKSLIDDVHSHGTLQAVCRKLMNTIGFLWDEIYYLKKNVSSLEDKLNSVEKRLTIKEERAVISDPDDISEEPLDLSFIVSICSMLISFICFIGIFIHLKKER